LSTFLDFLRIGAASCVFLGHTNFSCFFGESSIGPQNGLDYVIIFFVLSGFVIAWSVDRKNKLTFYQYAFDRLTRLWSVVLPALTIGFILDWLGQRIHPETYDLMLSSNHQETKILLSALFLHETWFFSIRPGSNGPFWSLSYEFFYYLIFGAFMLLPTLKNKIAVGGLGVLIAGPKVLLLLPCWLFGVIAYHCCKLFRPSTSIAICLIVISGFFLFSLLIDRWGSWHPWDKPGLGMPPLFYSAKFLDDYLIATSCAFLIYGSSRWFTLNAPGNSRIQKTIKSLAGCSFSLYVLHFPLIVFISALWASGKINFLEIKGSILLVLIFCLLFSILFERQLSRFRTAVRSLVPQLSSTCGIRS
tara:strand:- start:2731 stop:3810 length:1080 start_codon:yes stop_codon:yes gene_type:complete